jgi:transcriptional regulator with XRE-family HTH domain
VPSPLADRIRQARERLGLTQQDVAAAVGVSLRTFGNWERGETVPQRRLAKLEDVLGTRLRGGPETLPSVEAQRLAAGSGVDPEVLILLAEADPAAVEAVRAVLKAARRGD